MVLDGGGDEVGGFAVCGFGGEDAEEGEVVALGAAGGEDDLGVEAVEETGDGGAGCSTAARACWPCWWMELALP